MVMAGTKLSALSALSDVTLSDLLHLLDASETVDANKNKKVTLGTLLDALRLVSAISSVDTTADKLLAVDADGSVVGSIVINTLQLTASQIASGTLADARIAASNVTQHQAALSITESQISDLGSYMENLGDDTTPQLGGPLNVTGQKIVSASNGNIDIEPHGTGNVLLGNFTFDADQTVGAGQDNYVLTYDHASGVISLEAAPGAGGGIDNVVDDTTPQLGGDLDVNLYAIVSQGGNDIEITPDTSGSIVLDGLSWPQADGTSGQVLKTDGAGQLSWVTVSGGASSLGELSDVQDSLSGSQGDLLYFDGTNWNRLAVSATDGHVLTADGIGSLGWEAPAGGGASSLGELSDVQDSLTGNQGDLLYFDGTNWNRLAVSATDGHVLTADGIGSLGWEAPAGSGELALGDLTDVQDSLSGSLGDLLYNDGTNWTVISSSGASDGHVLTSDGAGGLAFEAPATGSGEANTASNVGASGVGVFSAKVSDDLQFNKVAGGTGISVSLASNVITVAQTALTASRALVSDGSGNYAVSDVTATELSYLDGVTSAIQTQIDGKAASSHNHAASEITSGTLAHERGGIEADISAIAIGDILAGTGTGTIGIVSASAASDGDVLTIQADGSVAFETPSGGGASSLGDLSDVQDSLTGNQGDLLYHNGTEWTSLAKGSKFQLLVMNTSATEPQWANNAALTSLNRTGSSDKWLDSGAESATFYASSASVQDYFRLTTTSDVLRLNAGTTVRTEKELFLASRIHQGILTLTDGATVTVDFSAGNQGKVTIAGNRAIAFSNAVEGQSYKLRIQQDGTGSRTVTWPSSGVTINWPGGSAPTLATTAGHADVIVITCIDDTPSAEIYDAALAMADLS
jgi:hypothetical protein